MRKDESGRFERVPIVRAYALIALVHEIGRFSTIPRALFFFAPCFRINVSFVFSNPTHVSLHSKWICMSASVRTHETHKALSSGTAGLKTNVQAFIS